MPILNPCPVLTGRNDRGGGRIRPGRSDAMLMTKQRHPAIRTLRGWALACCKRPAQSTKAKSTAGRRIAPILMPENAPSTSPAWIRRLVSRRRAPSRRSATRSDQLATLAQNARRNAGRASERTRKICRAVTRSGLRIEDASQSRAPTWRANMEADHFWPAGACAFALLASALFAS